MGWMRNAIAALVISAAVAATVYVSSLRIRLAEVRTRLDAAKTQVAQLRTEVQLNARMRAVDGQHQINSEIARRSANEASVDIEASGDLDAAVAAYLAGLGRVRDAGAAAVDGRGAVADGSPAGG